MLTPIGVRPRMAGDTLDSQSNVPPESIENTLVGHECPCVVREPRRGVRVPDGPLLPAKIFPANCYRRFTPATTSWQIGHPGNRRRTFSHPPSHPAESGRRESPLPGSDPRRESRVRGRGLTRWGVGRQGRGHGQGLMMIGKRNALMRRGPRHLQLGRKLGSADRGLTRHSRGLGQRITVRLPPTSRLSYRAVNTPWTRLPPHWISVVPSMILPGGHLKSRRDAS